MSWEALVPLAVFFTIAFGTWGALTALAERQKRAADRLERLIQNSRGRRGAQAAARRHDRIQNIVAKAAPKLAKPLTGKEADIGKLRLELLNAGFRAEQAVQVFLAIKFLLLLVALAVAIPLASLRFGLLTRPALTWIVIVGGAAFYLPSFVLGFMRKGRQQAIFLGLPDALDLMIVCVEAGLGLDAAMRRVANEMIASCPEICEEMAIANFQVQMGRTRRDVLHDLGRRTGVADVKALAAILIQAERFGSSISTALRVQSDSMRIRRRQLAEERAAKTAVQLIFPLVLFIFPGIFVVLVGPAAIQISSTLIK